MPIVYRYGLLLLFAFFFVLMGNITLQYLPVRTDAAFLQIKQEYIHITPWLVAFFVHVFTSMFVLAAGFTQFSKALLHRYRTIHRAVGKCYVVAVLFVTGPASFIMALLANGGIPSRIAFTSLSVLWMYTTAKAWRTAVAKQFDAHRDWMYRSYALTLSAITLRGWKWLLITLFHLRPLDTYMIVAWMGFVPNLVVAEWLIRKRYAAIGEPRPSR
ncbi:DUF2306 domain-containing protein [Dinghuibacter silviterrae]|uniref:Putative membrane protein DUF2306 n=1 Tax=Dinghuibacter silviterrae TaxID=1539049 RepID=A0A4R8DW45_9BACT|nr:DUF2306 domain-containing protein [Dinghuibacter silviterrae]TDX02158.1 putative membrane protein DUF2306 [Dinghuibacter silviterrae]